MRYDLKCLILAGLLLVVGASWAQTSAPANVSGTSDVLYQDDSAQSSATITQVLPNSTTSLLNLGAVRKIRVQQEIFVVEWGGTATTMLPRQYVASVTVNKRATPDAH